MRDTPSNPGKKRNPVAVALVACALLAGSACGHDASGTGIRYYKSLGSVQCTGGGKSAAELGQDLTAAGVTVIRTACGVDGNLYAAVCGAPDGRIGIFEIEAGSANAAAALGFAPLTTLPEATEVPCDPRAK